MNITIVTPAPPGSRKGNRVTALRWGRLLRQLCHRVAVRTEWCGSACDLLIALHARRSFAAVQNFRRAHPDRAIILALTGTDLYHDIRTSPQARQALEMATRLVVLQPLALAELPAHLHGKTRVILQSCEAPRTRQQPRENLFEVCVLGHLRPVKDPLRTALASRRLPGRSRIRVLQIGEALSPGLAAQARAEAAVNPRYRWIGPLPRWQALRVLARCRLLVLTSKSEGGANVISEALAVSVPVLASRIPGSTGILGPDYPGYFAVGNTAELADLLTRAEADASFYNGLRACCRCLRPLVRPARERQSWQRLLAEM